MTRSFIKRTVKIAVVPKGETLFSEKATYIEITDESGGEFVEISQETGIEGQRIRFDDDEWPSVRDAVDEMFKEIKKHENKS